MAHKLQRINRLSKLWRLWRFFEANFRARVEADKPIWERLRSYGLSTSASSVNHNFHLMGCQLSPYGVKLSPYGCTHTLCGFTHKVKVPRNNLIKSVKCCRSC